MTGTFLWVWVWSWLKLILTTKLSRVKLLDDTVLISLNSRKLNDGVTALTWQTLFFGVLSEYGFMNYLDACFRSCRRSCSAEINKGGGWRLLGGNEHLLCVCSFLDTSLWVCCSLCVCSPRWEEAAEVISSSGLLPHPNCLHSFIPYLYLLLRTELSLDPRAEAEIPTVAISAFINKM